MIYSWYYFGYIIHAGLKIVSQDTCHVAKCQWVLEPDGPVDTHPSSVCPAAAACWLLALIDMAQGHPVPSSDFLTLTIDNLSPSVSTCGCGLETHLKASPLVVVAVAVSPQRGCSTIHTWIELTRPLLCSVLVWALINTCIVVYW